MSGIRFNCPYCSETLLADATIINQAPICEVCERQFRLVLHAERLDEEPRARETREVLLLMLDLSTSMACKLEHLRRRIGRDIENALAVGRRVQLYGFNKRLFEIAEFPPGVAGRLPGPKEIVGMTRRGSAIRDAIMKLSYRTLAAGDQSKLILYTDALDNRSKSPARRVRRRVDLAWGDGGLALRGVGRNSKRVAQFASDLGLSHYVVYSGSKRRTRSKYERGTTG